MADCRGVLAAQVIKPQARVLAEARGLGMMCSGTHPLSDWQTQASGSAIDAAGASTRSPPQLVEEVKQVLRVQLLVARDGKPPGIGGYKGKGPLRGWLRITATREAVDELYGQALLEIA